MNGLITWFRQILDEDEQHFSSQLDGWQEPESWDGGDHVDDLHELRWRLADITAKRAILDLHTPVVENVEWWDSTDGSGRAAVCDTCGNREPNEWDLGVGNYGVKPEGWVSGYVLWPCQTVRLLATAYASREGFRGEWRPA